MSTATVVCRAATLASAATFYVQTDGNNANTGAAPGPATAWKTIAYAVRHVGLADTIYVKTGTYGVMNDLASDPSHQHPEYWDSEGGIVVTDDEINIIGYSDTQNLDSGVGIPSDYVHFLSSPQNLMPRSVGKNRTVYTGVTLSGVDYVEVRNLAIENFREGVVVLNSQTCSLKRLVCRDFGNTSESYDGFGINVNGGQTTTIENCFVINAGAEAICLAHGFGHCVDACQVYSDDLGAGHGSTDYYVLLRDARMVEIRNCHIERPVEVPHKGHGYHIQAVKQDGEDSSLNIIDNCKAVNIGDAFIFRGGGVHDNTVMNSEAKRSFLSDPILFSRIVFLNGAHDNVVRRTRSINARTGIAYQFQNAPNQPNVPSEPEAEHAAASNIVENCIFEDVDCAIHFAPWTNLIQWKLEWDAHDNEVINCTFIGSTDPEASIFWTERKHTETKITNCIFTEFSNLRTTEYSSDFSVWSDPVQFLHSCFDDTRPSGSGVPIPSEQTLNASPASFGNIVDDPDFSEFFNFNLNPGSPCVDAGFNVGTGYSDVNGDSRPQRSGYDIGAQELPD